MPKGPIRSAMLQQRQDLSVEAHLALSLQVQKHALISPEFAAAKTVALYSPIRNEVLTGDLLRAAIQDGKRTVFPRVHEHHLEFVVVKGEQDLAPGAFGIREPAGKDVVEVAAVDLFLLPGLAFDLSGHRLGYGRGFYDRALCDMQKEHAIRAGLSFDFQLVESLPAQAHDIRMHVLITESGVRRIPFGKQVERATSQVHPL